MLKPVMCARKHRAPLVPDDLLMVQEADPQQAVENLPGELRRMPYIPDFQGRNQSKCLRPVGARTWPAMQRTLSRPRVREA